MIDETKFKRNVFFCPVCAGSIYLYDEDGNIEETSLHNDIKRIECSNCNFRLKFKKEVEK